MTTIGIRTRPTTGQSLAGCLATAAGPPAAGHGGGPEPGPAAERERCPPGQIRHVLVPLDGSKLAECVLPFAAAVADAWSARLSLLRVLEPAASAAHGQHVDPVEWEILRAQAHRQLEGLQGQLVERGLRCELALLEGRPEEQILGFAAGHDVDLIVLSSHGEGGLSGWSLSSTALKVIARAQCSLFIVPAYEAEEQRIGTVRFGRILVPLDCSSRAECSISLAEALVKAHAAELVLLHVVPEPEMPRRMPPSREDLELADRITERNRIEGEKYQNALRGRLVSRGMAVASRTVESPHSARTIREVAERENVDLVVICAHGASGDRTERHGRVATRLMQQTTKPTIVFQDLVPVTTETTRAEEVAKEQSGH